MGSKRIKPALKGKVKWAGWHPFRRGLATNLHSLGVQDKTIQAILRHSDVAVTQRHYIKVLSPASIAAMKKLAKSVAAQNPIQ
jgi:integrase